MRKVVCCDCEEQVWIDAKRKAKLLGMNMCDFVEEALRMNIAFVEGLESRIEAKLRNGEKV